MLDKKKVENNLSVTDTTKLETYMNGKNFQIFTCLFFFQKNGRKTISVSYSLHIVRLFLKISTYAKVV